MDKLYTSSELGREKIILKEICKFIPDNGFIFCIAYKDCNRFIQLDGNYEEKKLKLINNGLRIRRTETGKNKKTNGRR